MAVLDLLDGDLAVQLDVPGHEDLAQPTARVQPDDAIADAAWRGRARDMTRSQFRRASVADGPPSEPFESLLNVGIGPADRLECGTNPIDRAQRGQALRRVAAVLLDMPPHQRLEQARDPQAASAPALRAARQAAGAFCRTQAFIAATRPSRVMKSI